jgi:hypothetical protein
MWMNASVSLESMVLEDEGNLTQLNGCVDSLIVEV